MTKLERARDDAEHALQLATRTRRLPWQELEACQAHAHLDHLDGQDRGWRARGEGCPPAQLPQLLSARGPAMGVRRRLVDVE